MGSVMLCGQFELTIDDANRLLIPRYYRLLIEPVGERLAFLLVTGAGQWPWLYPERGFEELVARSAASIESGDGELRAFAMPTRLQCNARGRIRLPVDVATKLGREIVIAGVRDHLEIWPKAEWSAYIQKLLAARRR